MSRFTILMQGSSLWRFLRLGVADAEGRVSRFLAPAPAVDPLVARAIAGSSFARLVHVAAARIETAGQRSWSVRAARAIITPWRDQSIPHRRRNAGVAVLAAVTSHLVLSIAGDPPTGWYWLILPSLAAAAGLVLVAVSPTSTPGSR